MRFSKLLFAIIASAGAAGVSVGGCAGTATGTASYSATASYDTPDLVDVGGGVRVIADYDEPIFYSGGFYWRQGDGGWYRSDNYASGFVYVDSPPVEVTRIEQPERYRHYRPNGYVARHRPERRPEPIVRNEQRNEQPTPVEQPRREEFPRRPVEERRDMTPEPGRNDRSEPVRPEDRRNERSEPQRQNEPPRNEPQRTEPPRTEPTRPVAPDDRRDDKDRKRD